MSMMYELDKEEEVVGVSGTPEEEDDASDKVVHFTETCKHLENLAKCLVCTKCKKLPNDKKVWMLGCCLAKYCESCTDKVSGSSCLSCGKKDNPKDKHLDLFSSSLLAKLPDVYLTIMKLEEMSSDKKNSEDEGNGEVDKQQVDQVLDLSVKKSGERELVLSKEMVRNPDTFELEFEFADEEYEDLQLTPEDQVMPSQDFPEVLEETPENTVLSRVRASLSTRKGQKKIKKDASRTLNLQVAQEKESEVAKAKTPTPPPPPPESPPPPPPLQESPEKKDQSALFLEELFQQSPVPSPAPAPVIEKTSPVELPILTLYEKASANKQKVITDTPLKGKEDNGNSTSKSSRTSRGRKRLRSPPGEEKPPALTPHEKGIKNDDYDDDDKDFKSIAKRLVTRSRSRKSSVSSTDSRKSTRGRRGRKAEPKAATKASLLIAQGKSPEYNPKVVMEDICKIRIPGSSDTTPVRLRRTPLVSKEKRNANGETKLHVACRLGLLDRVKSLVENGADVNATDNAGWTPIHEVINGKSDPKNKEAILRIFCEKEGNVNAFGGQNEETPLHFAVQNGEESLVKILLEFGASPNIRCKNGQLPKDFAMNDVILKLLEEKIGISPNVSINLNSSSVLSEDHALMQTMLKKAVVFFNYDVDNDVRTATKTKLNLKVADKLGPDVTHVIHKLSDKKEKSSSCVPISLEFLYALANCMWQVNSGWIDESLKKGSCVVPCSYEILGCLEIKREDTDEVVPGIARINKEDGNPGLLDGFCFYLYKTCGYTSGSLKLTKKNLIGLIESAGGRVTNREPNPETIDPCEAPPRFHVLNNLRGSDDSSVYDVEKLTLTTHIYLYEDGSAPPSQKLYNMEHVKSLKSGWLIDCLAQFRLLDPTNYL